MAVVSHFRRLVLGRRTSQIPGSLTNIPRASRAGVHLLALALTAGSFAVIQVAAWSQATSRNDLSEYTSAVAHPQAADRIRALEDFAQHAQSGPLKIAALQFVIAEYLRAGNRPQALSWAKQLERADPENALALAVITDDARNPGGSAKVNAQQQLQMAARGSANINQFMRPLGMTEAEFGNLRQKTQAMLKGAAGAAQLQRKDYSAARNDLREALALDPNNVANVYALALADLEGKDANAKEGYWYLGRAVDLSRGTPRGEQIAIYARDRYLRDGGSSAAWDQFLASAAPTRVTGPQATTAPAVVAKAGAPNPIGPNTKSATSTSVAHKSIPPVAVQPKSAPAPSVWADDTLYSPPAVRKRRPVTTSGPISLGILIETSLTGRDNRSAIANGLTDMLRHLGENDEAFVLTYDNNLVFETDLTTDPHQLEQALSDIKPQKGAVLDDAVAFAAGHLARIAKNPNRILLVISDGRDVDSQTSALRTSAEINAAGVRIYCIGLGVDAVDGRYRLQALSSSTGGRSDFISDSGQFRNATREIAQKMGIDFRF